MRLTAVTLRNFRNYAAAEVELGSNLTVITGPNGAGKTNLLEAAYYGCTAHSPRTSNERELVRRGETVARVTVRTAGDSGEHLLEAGLEPGQGRSLKVDGTAVDSLSTSEARPLLSVFLPERLELVKGAPAARRAHLDAVIAALWPARAQARAAYSRALAQRNALLGRIRAGSAGEPTLASWERQLARQGIALMAARAEAVGLLGPAFAARAEQLGLPEEPSLEYRPRSGASSEQQLADEFAARRPADVERGFTAHGPHRDDLQLAFGPGALRRYGSQGQQRLAVLALLFGERDVLAEHRGRAPVMLLDDVLSELDSERRGLLAELIMSGGQSVVTATDREHVPVEPGPGVALLAVDGGAVSSGVLA